MRRRPVLPLPALPLASILTLCAAVAGCPADGGGGGGGSVDVLVAGPAGPLEGATVLRHAADGTWIETAETDAEGTVSIDVDAGDLITAVRVAITPDAFEFHEVRTIGDVREGDSLVFWFPTTYTTPAETGSADLTLSGAGFPGGTDYLVGLAGCPGSIDGVVGSAGVGTVAFFENCEGTSFTPFAWVNSGGDLAAFQFLDPVERATLESTGAALDGPWRTDWTDVPLTVTNLPAGSWGLSVFDDVLDAEGRSLWSGGHSGFGGASVSTAFERMPVPAAASHVTVQVLGTDGLLQLESRGPVVSAVDVDAATDLPAYLGPATLVSSGASLSFSWTGGPAAADYVELHAGWYFGDADIPKYLAWVVRLPPDAPSPFVLPSWPTGLAAAYVPPPVAEIAQRHVTVVDAEHAGWDEARVDDPRDAPATWTRRSARRSPAVGATLD